MPSFFAFKIFLFIIVFKQFVFLNHFFLLISFMFGCAGSLLRHRLFSSWGEQGLLFVALHKLLIVVASPVANRVLGCAGFGSCSTPAQPWQFPGFRAQA